jgi:hypothetical protein
MPMCCSEAKEDRGARCYGVLGKWLLPVDYLWSYGVFLLLNLPRVFDLVFFKTLFSNKYYILCHWLFCIHFLYSMCVNSIPAYTYYEHLV